jgi:hypothetical protein
MIPEESDGEKCLSKFLIYGLLEPTSYYIFIKNINILMMTNSSLP